MSVEEQADSVVRGAAAMTPLTRSELRLLVLLEEVHLLAKELGIDVSTLYVPRKLRTEAWLWRVSQRYGRR